MRQKLQKYAFLIQTAVFCSVLVVAGLGVYASSRVGAISPSTFTVKVMVVDAFDGEAQPWLDNESWPLTFTVPGAHGPVHCQNNGICLTTSGEGKSNSGPTMAALLASQQLNTQNAYFIVAAIAGTRPDAGTEGFKGTLGFVGIPNYVVDGDLGTHFDYRDVTSRDPADVQQNAWIPLDTYDDSVFHLNETLAKQAYNIAKHVTLADDATAQAARNQYPSQAGMHPFVARCDTVGADDFFSGTNAANTMDHIVRFRTNGAATKCTSEFEDPAFANALQLRGMLNRLIIVRAASDFETPAPGQDAYELINSGFPGYSIATQNEYLVGSAIAHALAN